MNHWSIAQPHTSLAQPWQQQLAKCGQSTFRQPLSSATALLALSATVLILSHLLNLHARLQQRLSLQFCESLEHRPTTHRPTPVLPSPGNSNLQSAVNPIFRQPQFFHSATCPALLALSATVLILSHLLNLHARLQQRLSLQFCESLEHRPTTHQSCPALATATCKVRSIHLLAALSATVLILSHLLNLHARLQQRLSLQFCKSLEHRPTTHQSCPALATATCKVRSIHLSATSFFSNGLLALSATVLILSHLLNLHAQLQQRLSLQFCESLEHRPTTHQSCPALATATCKVRSIHLSATSFFSNGLLALSATVLILSHLLNLHARLQQRLSLQFCESLEHRPTTHQSCPALATATCKVRSIHLSATSFFSNGLLALSATVLILSHLLNLHARLQQRLSLQFCESLEHRPTTHQSCPALATATCKVRSIQLSAASFLSNGLLAVQCLSCTRVSL